METILFIIPKSFVVLTKSFTSSIFGTNSYGTHIPYYFKTLDIINFDYKINTNITIGTGTKQGKVHIDKLVITLSLGL